MAKPRFRILQWGPVNLYRSSTEIPIALNKVKDMVRAYPRLKNARNTVMDAHSTVGLVEYDSARGKKFMMLDLGMSADWNRIRGKMRGIGCHLGDVTHILQTHWDEDHFENITRFPHVLCVWGVWGPTIGMK